MWFTFRRKKKEESMIQVRNLDNTWIVYKNANRFFVESNGDLTVKANTDIVAVHARGHWASISVDTEKSSVDLLDLDKLEAMLPAGQPLYLTSHEYSELRRRVLIDFYSLNGVTTYTWNNRAIHVVERLYESEIAARSAQYLIQEHKD